MKTKTIFKVGTAFLVLALSATSCRNITDDNEFGKMNNEKSLDSFKSSKETNIYTNDIEADDNKESFSREADSLTTPPPIIKDTIIRPIIKRP